MILLRIEVASLSLKRSHGIYHALYLLSRGCLNAPTHESEPQVVLSTQVFTHKLRGNSGKALHSFSTSQLPSLFIILFYIK